MWSHGHGHSRSRRCCPFSTPPSVKEAQKKIYIIWCVKPFGFGAEMDEATSKMLKDVDGVLHVHADWSHDIKNKDDGVLFVFPPPGDGPDAILQYAPLNYEDSSNTKEFEPYVPEPYLPDSTLEGLDEIWRKLIPEGLQPTSEDFCGLELQNRQERMVEMCNAPTEEGLTPKTAEEIKEAVLGVRPGYTPGLGYGVVPPTRRVRVHVVAAARVEVEQLRARAENAEHELQELKEQHGQLREQHDQLREQQSAQQRQLDYIMSQIGMPPAS